MNATGIILNYRRRHNLPRIVARMLSEAWIATVVIWDNADEPEHQVPLEWFELEPRVHIHRSERNVGTYGRYLAASMASTPLIATCDDDVLCWRWGELYTRAMETGRVACLLDNLHMKWAETKYVHPLRDGVAHETLLGWGAVFQRERLGVFEKYLALHGQDDLLERKADRFFTILQAEPHENIADKPQHLPGAMGSEALYLRGDHYDLNKVAAARAVEILNQ